MGSFGRGRALRGHPSVFPEPAQIGRGSRRLLERQRDLRRSESKVSAFYDHVNRDVDSDFAVTAEDSAVGLFDLGDGVSLSGRSCWAPDAASQRTYASSTLKTAASRVSAGSVWTGVRREPRWRRKADSGRGRARPGAGLFTWTGRPRSCSVATAWAATTFPSTKPIER